MSTVLELGGYGNAGAKICSRLRAHSDNAVRIGGRHPDRAQVAIDEFEAGNRSMR